MDPTTTSTEANLRLREALRFVVTNTLQSVIASTLVASALVFLLRNSLHTPAASIWLSVLIAIGALRVWHSMRVRTALTEQRYAPRHLQRFAVLALATGLIWAAAVWVLQPGLDIGLHAVVLLASAAIGTGGAFVSIASLRVALAIFWPPMLALLVFGLLDGRDFYLIVAAVSILLGLMLTRILVVLNRQFIEQVELRERNAELVIALQQRTADAEAANEAKSRFLVAASHDLRQPMHAIAIRSRALLQQELPGEVRHMAERLEQSVAAMQSLFDALLDISKLDAGNLQAAPAPFALNTLFNALREGYADVALHSGIELQVQPTGLWVHSDALLLERILRQLLDNAIRHAGPCRLDLRAEAQGDEVMIEVGDTGKGIADDQQQNIFKEFVQLENPERDRRKGMGLGLALVRRLSQLLDHRLDLQSTLGQGARFRIFLPAAVARPVETATESAPIASTAPAATSSPADREHTGPACIAVLDDDPDVLEAMSLLLSQWAYEVIAETHSPELMQALLARAQAPDLLICDYRLAEALNGQQVIENIRRHYGQTLPALLITGDLTALRGSDAETDIVVLRKPVAPSLLRAQVQALLPDQQGS